MNIPLVDLRAQYKSLKGEIDAAIQAVLDKCNFILGDEVATFESSFARFVGVRHGIGVSSGTEALHLALRAAGVGPGDEVITVANTFIATVLAITLAGAKPVLVDCEPEGYEIDVNQLRAAVTERTKAIMPVHLYGQCADMDPILELAHRKGLVVIEDAAQAHGAEYKGRSAGAMGTVGCFSFYPGKNLGAYGDGGIIVTNDDELADKLRLLRNWGSVVKYHHPTIGFNSRLDTIQAAVLNVKLKHLARWNEARRQCARIYTDLLASEPLVITPRSMPYTTHVYHLYVVQVPERDRVLKGLQAAGVGAGIHYPVPVHLQGAYAPLGHREGDFPNAERLAQRCLSLPLYAELQEDQIAAVVDVLRGQVHSL
ncbi:MAG: DegT/DnrJ/EryC1/StrS family aminotransferase [Verrucomicrobia bacterium]|nr:DegT/DnrJ/EryC1/StrS family aminotransferase [Verrucomicrobiota bacterium]